MAGVAKIYFAGIGFEQPDKERSKDGIFILAYQNLINFTYYLAEALGSISCRTGECERNGHKQCRRNSLACNVAHSKTNGVLIYIKEIVKVAANMQCRLECSCDVEISIFTEISKVAAQIAHLYVVRHAQLALHAVFVALGIYQVFDISLQLRLHGFERIFEHHHLIVGRHCGHFHRKISLTDFAGTSRELLQGTGKSTGNDENGEDDQQKPDYAGGSHNKGGDVKIAKQIALGENYRHRPSRLRHRHVVNQRIKVFKHSVKLHKSVASGQHVISQQHQIGVINLLGRLINIFF